MKVLLLYDYPSKPGGLSTQGDLLYRGLKAIGVDVFAAPWQAELEKEWYYRWFSPDVVVGVGYWGHTSSIVIHPQKFGMLAVPWLVADGYIANYQDVLNELPLILVTSNWVKEMYVRDGISGNRIEVLPVGCDTDSFIPYPMDEPRIKEIREGMGVAPNELMILTVGGDAASKGSNEMMHALAMINNRVPAWKYICKVWPQPRTTAQNQKDLSLAGALGIERRVHYTTGVVSRNFMPFLIGACDIYAAPSRLEGFGMPQVEAGACGKPVIGIAAMGMLDTLVHKETAFLTGVARKIVVNEVVLDGEAGYAGTSTVRFETPRVVDYRADIPGIATGLSLLMGDALLRSEMGMAGRRRAVEHFDYRLVAKRFVNIIRSRLGIN